MNDFDEISAGFDDDERFDDAISHAIENLEPSPRKPEISEAEFDSAVEIVFGYLSQQHYQVTTEKEFQSYKSCLEAVEQKLALRRLGMEWYSILHRGTTGAKRIDLLRYVADNPFLEWTIPQLAEALKIEPEVLTQYVHRLRKDGVKLSIQKRKPGRKK